MGVMTHRRVRHLPVERDGQLIGLVSIGDVVLQRVQARAEEQCSQLRASRSTTSSRVAEHRSIVQALSALRRYPVRSAGSGYRLAGPRPRGRVRLDRRRGAVVPPTSPPTLRRVRRAGPRGARFRRAARRSGRGDRRRVPAAGTRWPCCTTGSGESAIYDWAARPDGRRRCVVPLLALRPTSRLARRRRPRRRGGGQLRRPGRRPPSRPLTMSHEGEVEFLFVARAARPGGVRGPAGRVAHQPGRRATRPTASPRGATTSGPTTCCSAR